MYSFKGNSSNVIKAKEAFSGIFKALLEPFVEMKNNILVLKKKINYLAVPLVRLHL